VEAAHAWDLAVGADAVVADRGQFRLQLVQVIDQERRVRLVGRPERVFHAQVQDGGTGGEPATASRRQDGRLEKLGHA
jgi:hypothetical protein